MFFRSKRYKSIDQITLPLEQAVEQVRSNASNQRLVKKIETFLKNDFPAHFNPANPTLYLSRHVATPNYETLRFIELANRYDLPTVIGQDYNDKFVSNNIMKRSLGKMSVTKGTARNGDEIVENFTVVDFSQAQGKSLSNLRMLNGKSLIEFHNRLLAEIYPTGVSVVDESKWIDKNHRGDLFKHYVKLLSLLICHGIMIEDYAIEDTEFVNTVLLPAFAKVEDMFGARPLIVKLIDDEMQNDKNWYGYPSILYQFIKKELSFC